MITTAGLYAALCVMEDVVCHGLLVKKTSNCKNVGPVQTYSAIHLAVLCNSSPSPDLWAEF